MLFWELGLLELANKRPPLAWGPAQAVSFHITSSPHPGTSLASLKMLAQKAFKLAALVRGESAPWS